MYNVKSIFTRPLTPILSSVTQLLAQNNCTYDEADHIIFLLQDWIKEARLNREYDTIHDYQTGNKTACMNNAVITPMGIIDEGTF